ncbi:MAG TPA: LysR family transcriptional regulator, partial [Firmicutes bacterium]|nr:LysR family transcriptional regulator [Bacillota bacterium]
MEIRVLRYFLAVVREENITKAAEILHITQPTLSRQIAQMEEEMGVKLFDRGTRKITLTNEGLLLRRRAEEILELVDKTERELTEQDEMVEGTVSIGCGDLDAV